MDSIDSQPNRTPIPALHIPLLGKNQISVTYDVCLKRPRLSINITYGINGLHLVCSNILYVKNISPYYHFSTRGDCYVPWPNGSAWVHGYVGHTLSGRIYCYRIDDNSGSKICRCHTIDKMSFHKTGNCHIQRVAMKSTNRTYPKKSGID